MEPQTITNSLQVLGGVALAGFSLFGVGAIALFLVKHYVTRGAARADTDAAIHETNNANQLLADGGFRQDLMNRIEKLELKVDSLQGSLNEQMTHNATLTAKNEALERDNERLTTEVNQLRIHRNESDATIATLRLELDALKLVVAQQHFTTDDPLPVALVEKA